MSHGVDASYFLTTCVVRSIQRTRVTVKFLRHARSICIMFFFGQITHVTMFLFNKSSKMYNVSPTWASSGTQINTEEAQVFETLYIFDDLLKRNIVTCVIRPKKNIIQNALECCRVLIQTQKLIFVKDTVFHCDISLFTPCFCDRMRGYCAYGDRKTWGDPLSYIVW